MQRIRQNGKYLTWAASYVGWCSMSSKILSDICYCGHMYELQRSGLYLSYISYTRLLELLITAAEWVCLDVSVKTVPQSRYKVLQAYESEKQSNTVVARTWSTIVQSVLVAVAVLMTYDLLIDLWPVSYWPIMCDVETIKSPNELVTTLYNVDIVVM